MSAYEGSKMQEADEARLRPGDKGYRAPTSPRELAFQEPDAKPRSLHGTLVALIQRFRTEYASVGTMEYKTADGLAKVIIDDNDGVFRVTARGIK